MNSSLLKKQRRSRALLSVSFAILSVVYLLPIAIVLMNSFKSNAAINTATFALPNEQTWMGLQNYIKGMTFGNYPFWKSAFYSVFITVVSSALILLCTSMAAWYIARVNSKLCRVIYYLCVFSMVVPFQMVMFTLSKTADRVKIPYFNFEVPTELTGVDSGILDPRDTYADPSQWDEKAKDLAGRFIKNFKKYETNEAGKALVAAGPQL